MTKMLPPEMARYQAIRKVGEGSFGAAILVTRDGVSTDQFIAKEMNVGKMTHLEREAVDSEVKILSQLKHPNIVKYEECVDCGGTLYIVMEFADGGDLFQRISSLTAPMSEDIVLFIFAQICLAVKYLHARRILHRDLKSQNVFLTKDSVVKLGDFGLATALRHSVALSKSLCGTPNYLSPELVTGRPYNNKADIWAMGCILYELVTQRFAFTGGTLQEIMTRIQCDQPAPIPTHYSEGLRSILSRMLCKEQAIRPSIDALMRANVLKDALHRIQTMLMKGEGVAAASSPLALPAHKSPEPRFEDELHMSPPPAAVPAADGVKSPQVSYVRDDELAELENQIQSDRVALTGVGDQLLQEIMEVNKTLENLERDFPTGDDVEEFGDDRGFPMLSSSPPTQSGGHLGGVQSSSLGGEEIPEIEGLLAEFERRGDL
eukprot:TRINITY_DN2937_c3_g2_i1.p1 TRINITY_DN2937_c3_g2~~TRINITY_DN2937_c3_g2_i1.p1  ORF type:complete len:433 (+),score=165.55 TRINITY_DN2937_c3_g2_i1:119-1417(+)